MDKLLLLTDGSVNPLTKNGYGAYLTVFDQELSLESLRQNIKVKGFESTSSTKLELQTLLWALTDIHTIGRHVVVYTDSQNIIGLTGRRERLEEREYRSKNNKRLNNYELYQNFFRITDQIDFELVKVRGHQSASQKNEIDKLFALVDRASRNAQRNRSVFPLKDTVVMKLEQ